MYKTNAFSSHTDNTIACGFSEKSHSSLLSKLFHRHKVMWTSCKNSLFFNFNFLSDAEFNSPIDENEKKKKINSLKPKAWTTYYLALWELPAKLHNMW